MDDFAVGGHEFQCHGHGHQRKDVGLHAVSEAVGQNAEHALLLADAAEGDGVAAGTLAVAAVAAVSGVDKYVRSDCAGG